MKLQIVYKEEIDGNWFHIIKDGKIIKSFSARDLYDTQSAQKAGECFDDYVKRAKDPFTKIIKEILI